MKSRDYMGTAQLFAHFRNNAGDLAFEKLGVRLRFLPFSFRSVVPACYILEQPATERSGFSSLLF